jgi:Sortase domain
MPKLLNGVIVAVIVGGITIAVIGGHTLRWSAPPIPPRWAAHPGAVLGPRPAPGKESGALARSEPMTISIPSIRVHAQIIKLGMTSHHVLQTPPLNRPLVAGWYDRGPTPGQLGAAVIVGHVDAAPVGPAVFYQLGELRPGDRIFVTLADHKTARFVVASAELYSKAAFPADIVYGPTRWPTLRLVTCGGVFDQRTGHYLSNTVIFATYTGHR